MRPILVKAISVPVRESSRSVCVHEYSYTLDTAASGFDRLDAADAIVLLHATGFHGRVFDATVDAMYELLERRGGGHLPRLLAIDLPGHGRSSKPSAASLTSRSWSEAAADIAEAARSVGVQKAIWVGHSAGGYCSLAIACSQEHRHLVAGLLLIDPVVFPDDKYEQDWALYRTGELTKQVHPGNC